MRVLPCEDSAAAAEACRSALDVPSHVARDLGLTAVRAGEQGHYLLREGRRVEWGALVAQAVVKRRSLPPDAVLPGNPNPAFEETLLVVRNETTLVAAERLAARNVRSLALNFANGVARRVGCQRSERWPT